MMPTFDLDQEKSDANGKKMLTYKGKTQSVYAWAKEVGIFSLYFSIE